MVAPALMVAANSIPGTPEYWKELPLESAALLVEFGADDDAGPRPRRGRADDGPRGLDVKPFRGPEFTREPETVELYWRVREGLHGLVGRLRPPGHGADRRGRLRAAGADRRGGGRDPRPARRARLPAAASPATPRRGTSTSCSPRTSPSPRTSSATRRSWRSSSTLIVDRYDGSLKAEHGTGVNMAPFVEREWGAPATEMMWRIKGLADPDGVLGPGVVLNRDPGCHLENLKTTPPIEEVGDDLRRVRLLRAGLPEPRPDDDAAPADRPAARDGAPAGRARRCSRS